MKIRIAEISDSEKIHEIHERAVRISCKDFYTEEQIRVWLEDRTHEGYHEAIKHGEMFVIKNRKTIIGFGHAIPGEIKAIFVDPEFQSKGAGKMLFNYGIEIAKKSQKKLEIKSTINAEGFYKKQGFKKIRDDVHTIKNVEAPIVILEMNI